MARNFFTYLLRHKTGGGLVSAPFLSRHWHTVLLLPCWRRQQPSRRQQISQEENGVTRGSVRPGYTAQGSGLLVLLAAQARVGVGHAYVQLACAHNDALALER